MRLTACNLLATLSVISVACGKPHQLEARPVEPAPAAPPADPQPASPKTPAPKTAPQDSTGGNGHYTQPSAPIAAL